MSAAFFNGRLDLEEFERLPQRQQRLDTVVPRERPGDGRGIVLTAAIAQFRQLFGGAFMAECRPATLHRFSASRRAPF